MRRPRESSAKGHGVPPLLVKDVEPMSTDQYPTARKSRKKMVLPAAKKNVTVILPNVTKVTI